MLTMLGILFLAFFSIPLHQRFFQINNADVVFNDYLNDLLIGCSAAGYFLSNYWKKEKICNNDDDCPDIMRCCEIGMRKYCCSPNNFVKSSFSFENQPIP